MKKFRRYLSAHSQLLLVTILTISGLGWLLFNHLGTIPGGFSATEQATATATYGWHGLYRQALYLPLNVVRSIIFVFSGQHDQLLSRLPNAIFGAVTILTFGYLLKLWHGTRTAIMGTILFASAAWTLHVSRLASNDVVYLWFAPTLLLLQALLHRQATKPAIFYGSLLVWGVLLYVPGGVWLVALSVFWQRRAIKTGWQHFQRWWQRLLYLFTGGLCLPLLVIDLERPGNFRTWLGLPPDFGNLATMLKHFGAVPIHLFIHGPDSPQLWLGRAPLLDIFTLVACVLGIYFYVRHLAAARSQVLASYFIVSSILVGLGGPVSFSLIVPLVYLFAATGIAYLLREWFRVFPSNPLARSLGLGLIIVAITVSGIYNTRAYFTAWANSPITVTTFHYHR